MTRRTPRTKLGAKQTPSSTTKKLRWVIEQYAALRPAGQAAIDKGLVALPRRRKRQLAEEVQR